MIIIGDVRVMKLQRIGCEIFNLLKHREHPEHKTVNESNL